MVHVLSDILAQSAPSTASMSALGEMVNEFMLGAVVMGCFGAGLFFLRFWKRTRDRLFLIFAIAFWLMGVNWLALAFTREDEVRTYLYIIRLLAFVMILYAIYDKNRVGPQPTDPS